MKNICVVNNGLRLDFFQALEKEAVAWIEQLPEDVAAQYLIILSPRLAFDINSVGNTGKRPARLVSGIEKAFADLEAETPITAILFDCVESASGIFGPNPLTLSQTTAALLDVLPEDTDFAAFALRYDIQRKDVVSPVEVVNARVLPIDDAFDADEVNEIFYAAMSQPENDEFLKQHFEASPDAQKIANAQFNEFVEFAEAHISG